VHLLAPAALCGSPGFGQRGEQVALCHRGTTIWIPLVLPLTARLCLQARLADIADKVWQGQPSPSGFPTLQVMHHVVPQPSTTSRELVSPSWRLSGACCSRHRVVYDASLQGLIGCLYTQGISPFFHAASRRTERTLEAVACPGRIGDYSTNPPTEPYVKISLIRFLGTARFHTARWPDIADHPRHLSPSALQHT